MLSTNKENNSNIGSFYLATADKGIEVLMFEEVTHGCA
jgi:hypothetical protein